VNGPVKYYASPLPSLPLSLPPYLEPSIRPLHYSRGRGLIQKLRPEIVHDGANLGREGGREGGRVSQCASPLSTIICSSLPPFLPPSLPPFLPSRHTACQNPSRE